MKYYTKPRRLRIKPFLLVIISIMVIFNLFIYFFNAKVFPAALNISENMVKAKVIESISETSIELFNEEFKGNELIIIDKDNEGTINSMSLDTIKLNYFTSKLSVICNEKLQNFGSIDIKVPLGWMTNQSIFFNIGPTINVSIEHVGNMVVKYDSKFESAGINMTRHKIYLEIETNVITKVPFHSEDIKIECEIPVSETILPGKVPQTAIDLGQNN